MTSTNRTNQDFGIRHKDEFFFSFFFKLKFPMALTGTTVVPERKRSLTSNYGRILLQPVDPEADCDELFGNSSGEHECKL